MSKWDKYEVSGAQSLKDDAEERDLAKTKEPSFEEWLASKPLSALQGVTLGFADEGVSALEALGGAGSAVPFGERYERAKKDWRPIFEQSRRNAPLMNLGGAIASGVATGSLPGVLAMGAAQGVGESEAPLMSVDTAIQAAKGAGLSGLGYGAAKGIGAGLQKAAPVMQKMADEAAMRVPGFRVPDLKKFLKGDLDESLHNAAEFARSHGLAGAGKTAEDFIRGARDLRQAYGLSKEGLANELEAAGRELSGDPGGSGGRLASELYAAAREADKATTGGALARELEALAGQAASRGIPGKPGLGTLPGGHWTLRETGLEKMGYDKAARDAARAALQQAELSPKSEAAATARRIIRQIEDDQARSLSSAAGKPELFDEFLATKKAAGMAAGLDDAARSAEIREMGNRSFGLTDSILASGGAAAGHGVGGFPGAVLGAAMAGGANKLARKFGPGIATTVLDKAAKSRAVAPLGRSITGAARYMGAMANPLEELMTRKEEAKRHFLESPDEPTE